LRARRVLGLLALLLLRTRIGLQMRAAATDFDTARLLGVRANTVIGVAVLLSALLAAAVAVILTVQNPLVSPDFALKDTIIVLVGVVVGGIDRLWTAMLGGFAIGFATGVINGALPIFAVAFVVDPSRRWMIGDLRWIATAAIPLIPGLIAAGPLTFSSTTLRRGPGKLMRSTELALAGGVIACAGLGVVFLGL